MDGGLAALATEGVGGHPAAGVAVDAAGINVEVAWGVLGAAVGQVGHGGFLLEFGYFSAGAISCKMLNFQFP